MKTSGYTLLEVMVALIIIGISITAVTGALSTAKGLSLKADSSIESVRILKNILNNPEIMSQIMESKNFEKVLEDEDGWICKAETESPIIIDSSDLVWDNVDGGASGYGAKKNQVRKNRLSNQDKIKQKKGSNSRKKNILGEEIELIGMVHITLCVSQTHQGNNKGKEYCISRWKRIDDSSLDTEIFTQPVKKEKESKTK
ncbi:MAG: type II secretion system protein [Desulfamplus sp.]|nr:type II secretion system protein [Desulfamplus sp.]